MSGSVRLLFRGHWVRVAIITVLSLVSGALQAAVLVLVVKVATEIAAGSTDDAATLSIGPYHGAPDSMLGLAAGLVIALLISDALCSWLSARLAHVITEQAQREFLDAYFGARWSAQAAHADGELQLMMDGLAMSFGSAAMSATSGLVSLGNFAALSLTALFVFPVATIIAVVAVGLLLLLVRPMSVRVRRITTRVTKQRGEFSQSLAEVEHAAREVSTFGVRDQVRAGIVSRCRSLLEANFTRNLLLKLGPSFFRNLALLLVVVTVGAVYWLDIGAVGALASVVLLLVRSLSYAQGVQTAQQSLHDGLPLQERFWATVDEYRSVAESDGGTDIASIDQVAFDGVSFTYAGADAPALDGVDLVVERGESIGIVGPSGAGKSTLVQLLLRLRSPGAGVVQVNGRDVSEVSLASFRRHVAYVPQEPAMVRGTVGDNVRFFREGLSDDDVDTAIDSAGLRRDIDLMPDGVDAKVTKRGDNLSGGQRQRVAIARALATDPDVLVLDEPTSALDAGSEAAVQQTLRSLHGRVTVFIVAHRLSTLQACDRILVIEAGRVTDFGPGDEVAGRNHFYREALRLSKL